MVEHWSERLRRVLQSRGWSYKQLAELSGVSREGIKKYVKGIVEKPRGKVIDKLAKALLVPTAWLRDGKSGLENSQHPKREKDNTPGKLATGVATVLFPTRDAPPIIREPALPSGVAAPPHMPQHITQPLPPRNHFTFSTYDSASAQAQSYTTKQRGRPRKHAPHLSNYWTPSSSSSSLGFQKDITMSQGSYTTSPDEGIIPSPSSLPPFEAAAAVLPPTTSTSPAAAVISGAPTDQYGVPVYDLSMLTRPSDIGRIEPLYCQPFDTRFLSVPNKTPPQNLFVIIVSGDSMAPTLRHGDRVMIDRSVQTVVSDGLYLLHWVGGMLIKRLSINPSTHLIHIVSDNTHYASYENIQPNDVHVVGRLVWLSRLL